MAMKVILTEGECLEVHIDQEDGDGKIIIDYGMLRENRE